ncbi:MAG: hypothetical protein Q7S43_00230 [bacterium]|nr:hypothetical protein [bacterium]
MNRIYKNYEHKQYKYTSETIVVFGLFSQDDFINSITPIRL